VAGGLVSVQDGGRVLGVRLGGEGVCADGAVDVPAAVGIPVDQLAGARLTAEAGANDRLSGWRRRA